MIYLICHWNIVLDDPFPIADGEYLYLLWDFCNGTKIYDDNSWSK